MEEEILTRKIIHVDMDAFYASVEQLDRPELRGKPLAVGGGAHRGVVAAASYEARAFGVRSAMPGSIAKRKCPQLIFVKPRFARYKEISTLIRNIFFEYTDLVEPLSLDEAFLDVTVNKKDNPSGTLLAQEIRQRIKEETGLNASAGISINKFLAKVASDINKPNGQKSIPPNEVIDFLEALPIERFFGVGKVTAEKMKKLGIFNGKDLKEKELVWLSQHFGKAGKHFYYIVRGVHKSKVNPNRIRKSVGAERTFFEDVSEKEKMLEKLEDIADEVGSRMEKAEAFARTIVLKVKYNDFTVISRSKTKGEYFQKKGEFFEDIKKILEDLSLEKPVRLLGITASNLAHEEEENKEYWQLTIDFPE